MPMVRRSFAEARARTGKKKVDRARIDAVTDEDIARQIADDPDVAPDMAEALERGKFVRLHVIDSMRTRMGMSHEAFAERFGLDPAEVKDRETMGGVPNETIRTHLLVIGREPEAVARAVVAIWRDEGSEGKRTVAP